MLVQYVGFTDKGKGKVVYLMQNIENGIKPLLIKGKFGLQSPYVSNNVFENTLTKYHIGDFIDVEFNQYGGVVFK